MAETKYIIYHRSQVYSVICFVDKLTPLAGIVFQRVFPALEMILFAQMFIGFYQMDLCIVNKGNGKEIWQSSLLHVCVGYLGVDPAQNLEKYKRYLCVLIQLTNRSIVIM